MPYLYKAGRRLASYPATSRVFGLGESNMENILHDMMEKAQTRLLRRMPAPRVLRARYRQGGHPSRMREDA